MNRVLCGIVLTLFISPAMAQGYNRPDIVRTSCHKDGCNEFSLGVTERLAQGPHGVLVRAPIRTYQASYQGRKLVGQEDGVVYCSRRRPAVLSGAAGPVNAYLLAPLNPAEYKQRIDLYALYFAVCDGPDTARAVMREGEAVAHRLGYTVEQATAQPVTLGRAEDILVPDSPRRDYARADGVRNAPSAHEESLIPPARIPDASVAEMRPPRRRGIGPDDFLPPIIRRLWE